MAQPIRLARVFWRAALVTLALLMLGRLGLAEGAHGRPRVGAAAGAPGPLDVVKSSVSRVRAIGSSGSTGDAGVEERRIEIRHVAEDLFDFDEMSRRVLGQHWKDLTGPQQAEFSRLFTHVIERFYVTAVEAYAGKTVAFQGEKVTGSYAQVQSRLITGQGPGIPIGYQLLERPSGWAVYDFLLDGVSLVANYRSQFNSIIRASSLAQLLDRLRTDRLQATELRGDSERSGAPQPAPSARERLVAGLLVFITSSRRQ